MILRLLDFLSVVVVALAAAALYGISYETGEVRREIRAIQGEIAAERARIAELETRWADLDSPANLRAQAEKANLGLQPASARQIVSYDGMASLFHLAAGGEPGALPGEGAPAVPGTAPATPRTLPDDTALPRTFPASAVPQPKPLVRTGGRP